MARNLIHTRTIVIEAYDEGDGTVTLEGRLEDKQPNGSGYFKMHTREVEPRPPGIIHGMSASIRTDRKTATIVKTGGNFPHTPSDGCEAVVGWLSRLEGIRISHGYSAKARELLGGPKGCAHMGALLQAIASTNYVAGAYFAPTDRVENLKTMKERLDGGVNPMTDTCHMWRKGGPIETRIRQDIAQAEAEGLL